MNIKLKLGILAAMSFSILMGSAQAIDTTINITGKVVASPCEFDGDSTLYISLGQNIETLNLAAANTAGDWVPFSFAMKNCPLSTTNVVATFSGTPDSPGSLSLYKNTADATNIAVEVQSNDTAHRPLGDGQVWSIPRTPSNTALFPMRGRILSKGGATAGLVAAVVNITFTYN
ncbi:fimbrial protein [Buttiauxella izardii]|uniref:Type 1 fimbrial protein n=1 Tax=Buttiauxella izardii TaxID=82991 RepID=A0A3A5KAJ8_9ENTR|nr:fimbrial protein [Buttiauxella izardii]RJT27980.1 type 1 fimbrial protein [Buttiauxella izardii]